MIIIVYSIILTLAVLFNIEMEMFYGDETIQGLIEHTTHMFSKIEEFEEFYSLISNPNEIPEEEELSVPSEKDPSETEEV